MKTSRIKRWLVKNKIVAKRTERISGEIAREARLHGSAGN